VAAFQKTPPALSGFMSLQPQDRYAARLRMLSILLAVADEVTDASRGCLFLALNRRSDQMPSYPL
jgi:hypothetical protein